jgi:uncharacterized protein YjbI with pentapeptide repeats
MTFSHLSPLSNLGNTDLRGAALRDAHLERADLTGAHLEGANLQKSPREGVISGGRKLS